MIIFLFTNTGPYGKQKKALLQTTTTNHGWSFSLFLNVLLNYDTDKNALGSFEVLSFQFLMIIFVRKLKIHPFTMWRNKKNLNLLEYERL